MIRSKRSIDYRVKGLDADSSIDIPLSGHELRYSFQPSLIIDPSSQTYLALGAGLWMGDGTSSITSAFTFDNVSSTDTDDTELILFDLSIGLGFRQFLLNDNYLFYELSTSRYDGRPLGQEVYGWENNLRAGWGVRY